MKGQMLGLWLICHWLALRVVYCAAEPGSLTYEHMNIALISSHSFCVIKVEAVSMNNNHSAFQSRTQNGHPYPARQRATLQPMQGGGRGESFLSSVRCWINIFHLPYVHFWTFKLLGLKPDVTVEFFCDLQQEVWEFRVIWSWRWRAGTGKRWCTPITVTALTARDQMRRVNTKHKEKTAQGTGKQSRFPAFL